MKPEYLEKLQKKTLNTLKFAIGFFERHNLKYYVCGGTCIGAVRHHNMVPWDDDVDLFMPHEDYKRLLCLKNEINNTGDYELLTPDTPDYHDPHSTLTSTDITIWKDYMNSIIVGVQIDIFPLQETNIEDEKLLETMLYENLNKTWKYQRANQKYPFARYMDNIQNFHLRGIFKNIKWAFSTRHVEKYRKELEDFQVTLHVPGGKKLVSFFVFIYGLETYEKEWFADYIEFPFADFKVRVPIGYDAYLKSVYGDYMKLPPKEHQQPKHKFYYMNLSERLTIDEVRKRIRKGEHFVL